jgi:hypothetical protein
MPVLGDFNIHAENRALIAAATLALIPHRVYYRGGIDRVRDRRYRTGRGRVGRRLMPPLAPASVACPVARPALIVRPPHLECRWRQTAKYS